MGIEVREVQPKPHEITGIVVTTDGGGKAKLTFAPGRIASPGWIKVYRDDDKEGVCNMNLAPSTVNALIAGLTQLREQCRG